MKTILIKTIILAILSGATLFLCYNAEELKLEEGSGVVMNNVWKIDNYTSAKIEPSEIEKKQLPEDTTFDKRLIYPVTATTQKEVLSNGVFATIVLSGADSRSIHRPEVCLPGQGWEIKHRGVESIAVADGNLDVMQLVLQRKDSVKGGGEKITRAVYSYFLVGKDVVTPHTYKRILISNWDNLAHNKAHRWAYPSFMATYELKNDASDQEQEQAMFERVNNMIKQVSPQILSEGIIKSL